MTETEAKSDPEITKDKHRSLTTKKILCIVIGVVVAGFLLPPAVPTALRRWPQLCCRYGDINIKTGQARYSRYLGFVKISEEVTDTPISLALKGKTIDVADIKAWHRVYTASPGAISPQYRYISALGQARQIELIGELIELSPEKRHLIAENVLKLWQTERGCYAVGDYLRTVLKEGTNISEQK